MTNLRPIAAIAALVLMIVAVSGRPVAAQETVNVTMPASIDFIVSDVSRTTSASPPSVRVSFSAPNLGVGRALRLSVQADTVNFTPPGGTPMPAALVSWTALGASGGLGLPGTLVASSYGLVFQGDPGAASSHVDLAWVLGAPGSGIRAGLHQLTIRWKIESISP